MTTTKNIHTFHIPVMGLAYTIDSPIRVAQYGISSVISITDDELIEKMRAFYSKKFSLPYQEITQKCHDYRAERIKHYLNMVDKIVKDKFESFKNELAENKTALENYIALLPNKSELKKGLQKFIDEGLLIKESVKNYLAEHFSPGEIDVNIMTKVDKDNFDKNEQLPVEFNDAHASLRGFAESDLTSSVVLSAGMNPRLYSYFEQFPVFYPDAHGQLPKKIILKVSDFRSAMIQGNFLAKKGLWVSEYRIESGLNCGGHAFATDGFLMGPILEEFKTKKAQLIQSAHELMVKALVAKNLPVPAQPFDLKITAQGGVGTAEEHEFLLTHFEMNAVGWGSPFLLVPEATSVDEETRTLLAKAQEKDFYLSDISPLGVPFNSVKGMSNDLWKQKRIDENKAGSSCPKKLLALSKEYDPQGMCTASKKYQDIKLAELEAQKDRLTELEIQKKQHKIFEKSCLCVGLANASYMENNLEVKGQQQGVVICPGPNLAYFDRVISLADMVKHIYGNANVMPDLKRPNMFVNELKMYVDYLKNELDQFTDDFTTAQLKKWNAFKSNLLSGIEYYSDLFVNTDFFSNEKTVIEQQLQFYKSEVNGITLPVLEAV
ncbi:hypothetical protein IVB69_08900 [Flavobacterium sp. J49]|uniref:hypothetical protein n=1 Tax=Flavobacterium sp. J49 TaxID=2718534 RepID=UPI0015931ACC|nr:hypothetical protein [Flavobacterium sp. J49]MBF6641598.1 hypothetical protein [Flavobacterium sp. J49]NIC02845.1 hypothetical protein [Flavobacterium sp. J49]